jgi:hypothetical protein
MRDAAASGRYRLPRLEGSVHRTPHEGVMMALMTRIANVDATDADQLSAAEIEGRRQCHEYVRFLRERVPGFERAVLVSTSPAIGVRESRRILGDYVLTAEDCLGARRFPDQIACCGAPIEDHHAGSDTRWLCLAEGATYGIPFRSLVPRSVEGVVVGQAAGTAAALCAESGLVPRELPAERVRARLREGGAHVGD